ncbi:MAG: BatA domain-containing protein [Verrucomicrobiota bacterium]
MTFLQPFILWGLPLILLPVIIHLLNRMRHRPQPWAAMRFLVSATRSSVNNAKLRQWLILALRVLAVLMLVLFLSRPLAGGWLGWALSPAPDAILLLLDRSASMETTVGGSPISKREQAVRSLSQAAKEFEENSHLVLIDSALRAPQELGRAESLRDPALTSATETAADIPGLIASALTWLVENRAGTAELWLASDLQRSSWLPDDARWHSLVTQLRALPQNVRVRLLALDEAGEPNRSVAVKEMIRRAEARGELRLPSIFRATRPSPKRSADAQSGWGAQAGGLERRGAIAALAAQVAIAEPGGQRLGQF